MARRNKRTRGRGRGHRRSHRGGGYSVGREYVSPGNLVIQPNTQPGGPDCLAASRPGEVSHLPYGGLPGMRGGRYTMNMAPLDASRGIVPSPAQAVSLPCEASRANPDPPIMRGGGSFPVLDVGKSADMMAYHAPTGGYSNVMSSSGGVPLMIQAPYAAKSCISTGGSRRKSRRKSRKSRRKSRKSY
jgi:hypothetical protein